MARRPAKKTTNVYAFIDSQNLNLGVQKAGFKMDWRRFRKFLADKYGVTKAYMFIGYMIENEQLYEYMHELGFLVVLKPTLEITAAAHAASLAQQNGQTIVSVSESDVKKDDKPVVKGNIDADLVLYAMKELPNYDKAIIVSGDGDFFALVEYLAEQGKLAHIMTPNRQYSTLLKPFEEYVIRIDQLKKELAYHDRRKPRKSAV